MDFIKNIGDYNNDKLIAFGNNGGGQVFTPPTKESSRRVLEKVKKKKAEIKALREKVIEQQNTPIVLTYLNNGVILLKNVNTENIKLIFDRHSSNQAAINIREGLRCGTSVLSIYKYEGNIYLAVMPAKMWKVRDWWKNYKAYCFSMFNGQYGKDIADRAEKINFVNTAYNWALGPVDKAFKNRADKISNVYLRRSLYALYGFFRAKVLIELLSINKWVGAGAASLYIVMIGARVIFDFRGIVDFFKNASWEEIWMLIGSLGAIGASGKNISKAFSGKKVSIGKGGQIKTEPIKGSVEQQAAADTGGAARPAGAGGQASAPEQPTSGTGAGQTQVQPPRPPEETATRGGQPARQAAAEVEGLRQSLQEKFDTAQTGKEKIAAAEESCAKGQYDLAKKLYLMTAGWLGSSKPRGWNAQIEKIYRKLQDMVDKGQIDGYE